MNTNQLQVAHIILVTLAILFEDRRNPIRLTLIAASSVLTYFFIRTDMVWIGFILWELISITSALLIFDRKPENLVPAAQTMFISLLSSACYLMSIVNLPLNATFLSIQTNYAQAWCAMAIVIKSGFAPFLWPQIASVADYRVSASLHSVTAIQLGIYLFFKTNLPSDLARSIISVFCIGTIAFSFVYLIIQKKTKSQVACLTQSTNAAILHGLLIAPTQSGVIFHAIYKSLLFILLGRVSSINNFAVLLFVILASVLIQYTSHSYLSLVNEAFLIFFYIKLFEELTINIRTEGQKESFKSILILLPLLAVLVYYSFRLGIRKWGFAELTLVFLISLAMHNLHKLKFREYVDFEESIENILNFVKVCLYILVPILIFAFALNKADLTNFAKLFTSTVQFVTIPTFCLGLFTLFRAKSKYELVIGMNLVSAVIAVLLFEKGGLEVCTTHIAADIITTIALLKTKHELIPLRSCNWKKSLYILPVAFIFMVLIHKQTNVDLIFPILGNLDKLNEIVVNWRLPDTLGEVLTFLLVRYI